MSAVFYLIHCKNKKKVYTTYCVVPKINILYSPGQKLQKQEEISFLWKTNPSEKAKEYEGKIIEFSSKFYISNIFG